MDGAIYLFSPYVFISFAEISMDKNTAFLFTESVNNLIYLLSLNAPNYIKNRNDSPSDGHP
jgi:hypothetical protein